jgi:hypothetical protein
MLQKGHTACRKRYSVTGEHPAAAAFPRLTLIWIARIWLMVATRRPENKKPNLVSLAKSLFFLVGAAGFEPATY